ncbi:MULTISPECIES: hypothetical protein [Chelativorans]|jgi:hypothetical protein|uniref:hypothetical protein n=1 Tax=Chelativorans TaxID=449972 RepID=UPI0002E6FE87|nr:MULTISPECIES: hypothetical protein [Chelativorans]
MAEDKERPQSDEKRFNETLKRMLKTPPKPHEKAAKDKPRSNRAKQDSKSNPSASRS